MLGQALHDRCGSALRRCKPFTELDQGSRFDLVDDEGQLPRCGARPGTTRIIFEHVTHGQVVNVWHLSNSASPGENQRADMQAQENVRTASRFTTPVPTALSICRWRTRMLRTRSNVHPPALSISAISRREGCAASSNTVLQATRRARPTPAGSPVLGFTSNLG